MRAADRVPDLVGDRIAERLRHALVVPRLPQTPRPPQPGEGAREAAVLILLCPAPDAGLAVVLVRKSTTLRSHAGQVAFPGGRREAGDADASATALREAAEEAGIVMASVEVVAQLPPLGLAPSNHRVTPVLAWWHAPGELRPDGVEVVAAAALPLALFADPAHRVDVRHPGGATGEGAAGGGAADRGAAGRGATWPGYDLPGGADGPGWFVWGFTAWLLTALLSAAGAAGSAVAPRVVDVPVGMR